MIIVLNTNSHFDHNIYLKVGNGFKFCNRLQNFFKTVGALVYFHEFYVDSGYFRQFRFQNKDPLQWKLQKT
jgi:hypothetical protein